MREGTELTPEMLRDEAAAAVERSGQSQAAVARELGVHRSAVSRAVKEVSPNFYKLQRRIIEHLTPYRLEKRERWAVRREENDG
jgi:predicted transcriptional regulator